MDYKSENPDQYWEIMNYLFKKDSGAGLTHIKIEMGSDVNSSSGTEPSTMRTSEEEANVNRGAGFMFAADALSINPDITVDLLRWGEPAWVTDAFSVNVQYGYVCRYKWFLSTIEAAYDEYGIQFSYISADANEPDEIDSDWIIYLSDHLKTAQDTDRYDYSQIKIVASDEVGSWKIADAMMENEALRNAVDVLSEHYNTYASDNAKTLNTQYGKEIWYSEGISPVNIATLAVTSNGSGINGVNGSLDVANRIINGYYNGTMTMYEYQPGIAAYYSGAKFYPKSLINATEPWSGYYELDSGLWMSAHFTMFMEQGWQYIDSACYGDGSENHSITNTTNNYMAAISPTTGDYSMVICNDSDVSRNYTLTVSNLDTAGNNVYIWETIGPQSDSDTYNSNYLKNTAAYIPVDNGDNTYSYSIEVKPYSIITITTLVKENMIIPSEQTSSASSSVLPLSYSDDFEYDDEYLLSRGNTPRYTTDQGGAFEVASVDGNKVLMQMTNDAIKPTDWRLRSTPNPITSLGDDRWSDYEASIDFKFDQNGDSSNYVGFGLRYLSSEINSNTAENGYLLKVFEDGTWNLLKNSKTVDSGTCNVLTKDWNTIIISANQNKITASLNNKTIVEYTDEYPFANSGRICISSNYYNNMFDNLSVSPLSDTYAITRVDDHDSSISYSGSWKNVVPVGYTEFNRTTYIADFSEESNKLPQLSFTFTGTEFALIGPTGKCTVEITIDGATTTEEITNASSRQCFYKITGLSSESHTVSITVKEGKFTLDAIEYK